MLQVIGVGVEGLTLPHQPGKVLLIKLNHLRGCLEPGGRELAVQPDEAVGGDNKVGHGVHGGGRGGVLKVVIGIILPGGGQGEGKQAAEQPQIGQPGGHPQVLREEGHNLTGSKLPACPPKTEQTGGLRPIRRQIQGQGRGLAVCGLPGQNGLKGGLHLGTAIDKLREGTRLGQIRLSVEFPAGEVEL